MQINTTKQQDISSILFTHYGENRIRGSERCLLDLLTHIDRDRFKPVVWCNTQVMADAVRALDVKAYQSDFSMLLGWKPPHFDFRAFLSLIRQGIELVDRHAITVLHANSGAPNQWLNFVARARRIPLVAHLHARYPLRDRLTLGLHQVPMAVGVSQPVIDTLLDDGMPGTRCRVIPNGIDTHRLDRQPSIDLRHQLNLKTGDFLIATVGSLIKRKGIDLIIDAVSKVTDKGVPVHLAIIGNGPEQDALLQQTRQKGIDARVHFLGEQLNVAGLLRGSADLFVSGAREEVFGLVLAEAGLAGIPVIAPAVGGIPGVIADGETGLLVPPGDAGRLADTVFRLYRDKTLRTRMGAAGRRRVLERFTIERNVRSFEQLYDSLARDPEMQTAWSSHWQWRRPLSNATKRVFDLAVTHQPVSVAS